MERNSSNASALGAFCAHYDRMGAPRARAMITCILIICCVPEMAPVATAVRQAFESKCRVYGHTPTVDVFTRHDRGVRMAALSPTTWCSQTQRPSCTTMATATRPATGAATRPTGWKRCGARGGAQKTSSPLYFRTYTTRAGCICSATRAPRARCSTRPIAGRGSP